MGMSPAQTVQSVVFDLDGTLWPPQSVVIPAYQKVFRHLDIPYPVYEALLETLGHPFDVIWQKLMPDVSQETRAHANELMALAEAEMLGTINVEPFVGVRDTLHRLRLRGVSLYILSNCEHHYLERVPDCLGIGGYFQERYCADDFPGLSKSQILERILPGMPHPVVMVGDRFHDIDAGRHSGLDTIACLYGFGKPEELREATHKAQSFVEVGDILLRMTAPI